MPSAADFSDALWDLLHKAGNDPKTLIDVLSTERKETIAEWYNEFVRATKGLWQTRIPEQLHDVSDDTRADVMEYIVGKGPEFYDSMIERPEQVPRDIDSDQAAFRGAAVSVYWERFQEDIPRRPRK